MTHTTPETRFLPDHAVTAAGTAQTPVNPPLARRWPAIGHRPYPTGRSPGPTTIVARRPGFDIVQSLGARLAAARGVFPDKFRDLDAEAEAFLTPVKEGF